ncbi:MAG: hypothetical protein CVT92_08420 [Bacteroidetes bacterium HGW-Bacteroidetes-1]|jgi:hypothetical protein|nr:MAG: hypothetical protein CVT92_08420 [Bacteroidetes bacterium HGW-Bacteroidetes-1]
MRNSAAFRIIKLIMAFAIFWMVIGDLITYHQKVMFGVDFFEHHPFTKPAKDDGSNSHYKSYKGSDKQSSNKADFSAVVSFQPEHALFSIIISNIEKPHLLRLHACLQPCVGLRAPPITA